MYGLVLSTNDYIVEDMICTSRQTISEGSARSITGVFYSTLEGNQHTVEISTYYKGNRFVINNTGIHYELDCSYCWNHTIVTCIHKKNS